VTKRSHPPHTHTHALNGADVNASTLLQLATV
jgi:hypothetical protein